MALIWGYTKPFRDHDRPRPHGTLPRVNGNVNALPLAKKKCRREVLRCGCAWKSGTGIFLRRTGIPAVQWKGEDHDERDPRSRIDRRDQGVGGPAEPVVRRLDRRGGRTQSLAKTGTGQANSSAQRAR